MKHVLLDVHEALKQVEGLKELETASTRTAMKLKLAVAEKAEAAAEKLSKIHSYLIQAFDNKWEIVLHKAQVFHS